MTFMRKKIFPETSVGNLKRKSISNFLNYYLYIGTNIHLEMKLPTLIKPEKMSFKTCYNF